jgi:hypothetical protein
MLSAAKVFSGFGMSFLNALVLAVAALCAVTASASGARADCVVTGSVTVTGLNYFVVVSPAARITTEIALKEESPGDCRNASIADATVKPVRGIPFTLPCNLEPRFRYEPASFGPDGVYTYNASCQVLWDRSASEQAQATVVVNRGCCGPELEQRIVSPPTPLQKINQRRPLGVVEIPANMGLGFGVPVFLFGGDGTGDYGFTSLTGSVCSVSGGDPRTGEGWRVTPLSVGQCILQVTRQGDINYEPAEPLTIESQVFSLEPEKQQQVPPISFTRSSIPTTLLDRVDLRDFISGGQGSGALTFSLADDGGGICSLSDPARAILTVNATAGRCIVSVTQGEDATYAASTAAINLIVDITTRTMFPPLSFSEPGSTLQPGRTIDLSSLVRGGQAGAVISYALQNGDPCQISGSVVTAGTPGTCRITATATLAGYEPSTAVYTITVARQAQAALTLSASGRLNFPGFVTLRVTGGSTGGAVSYAVTGPCTVSGNRLDSTGVGLCTVTATMAGDGGFLDVTSSPLRLTVSRDVAVRQATLQMQQAMGNTARAMLGFSPSAQRPLGGNTGGGPMAFMPQGDSSQGSVAFAASLQQIANAAAKEDRQVVPTSAARPDASPDAIARATGSFDLWADARFVWFEGGEGEDGQTGFLGEAGIDYLLQDNMLIGVSLRLDRSSGEDTSGHGWLAGPYAVFEVVPGLRIDGKLQYGQGRASVAFGLEAVKYEGDYDTTRWLAEAGVRGAIDLSPVTIEPGLRMSWWHEQADDYALDNNGGTVAAQEMTLLRLALDPRVSFAGEVGDGLSAGPYFLPKLIAEWRDQTGKAEDWDVFGALEAGIAISGPAFSFGTRVEVSGFGADEGHAFAAGADLSIPLN